MLEYKRVAAVGCVWMVLAASLARAEEPAAAISAAHQLTWYDDYTAATDLAKQQGRMLLVYFRADGHNLCREFESQSLTDSDVQTKLADYVLVRATLDTEITIEGEQKKLIADEAFAELDQKPGLALVDLVHKNADYYRQVVTVVPLTSGKYYTFHPKHFPVTLDLPPGTLTQRTMVFAVRIHPEHPRSTEGEIDENLLSEAQSHSAYQARIRNQGHHQWGQRFQRISNALPSGLHAQEVVAESWPGEGLMDAAVDCIASWRQSSGHWSAVRGRQPRFGYDIRRGSNGIWYATGIFGNRN